MPEDCSPEAEDVTLLASAAEELPLTAAAVELAGPPCPGAQVAAVGRVLTPSPAQRELANCSVSELGFTLVSEPSLGCNSGASGTYCLDPL